MLEQVLVALRSLKYSARVVATDVTLLNIVQLENDMYAVSDFSSSNVLSAFNSNKQAALRNNLEGNFFH